MTTLTTVSPLAHYIFLQYCCKCRCLPWWGQAELKRFFRLRPGLRLQFSCRPPVATTQGRYSSLNTSGQGSSLGACSGFKLQPEATVGHPACTVTMMSQAPNLAAKTVRSCQGLRHEPHLAPGPRVLLTRAPTALADGLDLHRRRTGAIGARLKVHSSALRSATVWL